MLSYFSLESVLKAKILTDLSVGERGSDTVLEKRLKKIPDQTLSCTRVEFCMETVSVHSYFPPE